MSDGPTAKAGVPLSSFRSRTVSLPFSTIEVDLGSTSFLVTLAVAICTLLAMLWRARKRRHELLLQPVGVDTPAFQRLVAEQESRILALKEQGNRAYLERDYERSASLFAAASEDSIKLCKLQYPSLQVVPFAIPLSAAELDHQQRSAPSTIEPTGAAATTYPPAGLFRTRANPALTQLPTPLLNNLAVYASNRSACLLALNRYAEALTEAEIARHTQPLWSKGYLRAGQAYEGLGLLARAKAMYTAAARADASDDNVARCLRNLTQLVAEVEATRDEIERDRARLRRTATTAAPESGQFDALVEWLTSHGAQFPFLFLKHYSHDHRGVHTLCRLSAGKILLQIPHACIMSSDFARASRVGRALDAEGVELGSSHSYLACALLEERRKGSGSFWKPYIDILPKDYRNMPIFFEQDEKQWLRGSFTLAKVDERHRELRMEYENICSKLDRVDLDSDNGDETHSTISAIIRRRNTASSSSTPATSSSSSSPFVKFSDRHSLTDFIWARTVVITRVFGFTVSVPSGSSRTGRVPHKTDGLVPMADMLNHRRPRETSWNYDDARDSFVITSITAFETRQQVCDSYGRKCNSRFLINYGFCIEDNRDDNQAVVWVRLAGQAALEDAISSDDDVSESKEATALLEKKRRILGLISPNSKVPSPLSLAQSASSLSSSGFILSNTLPIHEDAFAPTTAAASSSFAAASASPAYPPRDSLRFQLPSSYTDKVTQEIFSILRIVCASDAHTLPTDDRTSEMSRIEVLLLRQEPEYAVRTVPPLSLRNEMAVLARIAEAATEALAQFETTRAQDDDLLHLDDVAREEEEKSLASDSFGLGSVAPPLPSPHRLSSNQRNCVIMRRGEKEVHEQYVSLLDECRLILSAYHSQVVRRSPDVTSAAAWQNFIIAFVEPRYGTGDGPLDFYISTAFMPLVQLEDQRRKRNNE